MPSPTCKYRFGHFELRTSTRELYKHGVKLKLRPQAYQVLLLLLEKSGDVVSRDELQKRVWPSNTFVDFEHGLNTAIKELRANLSDSASKPKYIETLPKLGYRLIEPVQAVSGGVQEKDAVEASKSPSTQHEYAPGPTITRTITARARWKWALALALGGMVFAIFVVLAGWPGPRSQPGQSIARSQSTNDVGRTSV